MLVVCALALVVAAAFFLVIGLAGGDVGDLYLSMVLCVASLVVVAVSARVSRARPAPVADAPPEPVAPTEASEDDAAEPDAPPRGLTARLAQVDATDGADDDAVAIWAARHPVPAAPEPTPEVDVEPAPQAEVEVAPAAVAVAERPDAGPFPIADYDDLEAAQILPLVPKLWPEEAPQVAERERATRARPAVLDALAERAGDPSLAFPIAAYESLDTEQITRLLARLDEADLATVQAAERAGDARVGVLVAVANQLASRQ